MKRVELIDSLRAFSLIGILLIHCIGHFNLYFLPDFLPPMVKTIDKGLEQTIYFIFSGKAYAIFSLLFGFSFFVQFNNQNQKGYDFRYRFAWRLVLLLIFAQLDSLFYPGDILGFYAIVGFVLILVCRWSDKAVFVTALILLLQPIEWAKFIYILFHPDVNFSGQICWSYYEQIHNTLANGTFLETLKANIWQGQIFSNLWQIESGRLFQTSALFLFGMLLGRRELYLKSAKNIVFWKSLLLLGIIAFVPLFLIYTYLPESIGGNAMQLLRAIVIPSLSNFAFTVILVAGYIILWHKETILKVQKFIIPYGRMSLTNYITMGMIGTFLFFGYGLSWYKFLGATQSFLIGIGIFIIQFIFSRWWLKTHKQGPLEYIWKRLTWIKFPTPTKKHT